MAHACNPSTWDAETGGLHVRGQPQQVVRLSHQPTKMVFQNKNFKPGMVAHACNPSTWEAETGGFVASLSYLVMFSAI